MSTQTTISQYFSNRKRSAIDEIKSVNQDSKLLTLDRLNTGDLPTKESDGGERLILKRKISWDSECEVPRKKVVTPNHYNPKKTPKFSTIRSSLKKTRIKSAEKSSARKALQFGEPSSKKSCQTSLKFDSFLQPVDSPTDPKPLETAPPEDVTNSVGSVVTPRTEPELDVSTSDSISNVIGTTQPSSTTPEPDQVVPKTPNDKFTPPYDNTESTLSLEPKPSTSKLSSLREELGLGEIRAKLKGSSRLDKIRDALKRVDKGFDKLAEIQARKEKIPSLSRFDSLEIEVPCSPVKNRLNKIETYKPSLPSPSKLREAVFRSPAKAPPPPGTKLPYVSPRKLLDEMRPRDTSSLTKSPVYQRYCSLAAQAGKPCLPLPYSYRVLGEVFRSVEVVISMLYNRKETVHFSKLKRSTQELNKKSLSERHLGQILKVFPDAFKLSYDKVKAVGKPDYYELTVTPILPSDNEFNAEQMVPSSTLERQRFFYKQLLELAKTHHEKYLLSLDPPLIVDREKLTRWHPGFDLDSCPEIKPIDLPKPPTLESVTSAKQLLGKAKEMFVVNPRMEKALEKLSQSEHTINSNGKPSAASVVPAWTNALKGLPKSLLEKVRAKQAAKAVEMLTRDPQKIKQDIEVGRLPEFARIMRNLYVTERKNVLLKSHVLDKLESSFRENLSASEMDRHLMLLVEKTKPWLKISKDGHVTYISMDKTMEMTSVYNTISPTS